MHRTAAATKRRRAVGPIAVGLAIVTTAMVGALVDQPASSPTLSFAEAPRGDHVGVATEADGAVPDGVTVFDEQYPAIANLNPDLLLALREAAKDAADQGIVFHVNSGWRSPAYQDQLLREAVSKYGSEARAARWVATADTSAHVYGAAVDIGPSAATAWLLEHGARYGLCRIYGNEPWHYELRPQAADRGCPPMYADPTQDPRMQQ